MSTETTSTAPTPWSVNWCTHWSAKVLGNTRISSITSIPLFVCWAKAINMLVSLLYIHDVYAYGFTVAKSHWLVVGSHSHSGSVIEYQLARHTDNGIKHQLARHSVSRCGIQRQLISLHSVSSVRWWRHSRRLRVAGGRSGFSSGGSAGTGGCRGNSCLTMGATGLLLLAALKLPSTTIERLV